MQREMLEMQRKIFQQFQQMSPDNPAFAMPDMRWDTTFSFHFDTLIDGNSMSRSFFFSPFGQDTSFMRGFGGDNPFFDQTNPFGGGFQWSFPPGFGFPENEENSALGDPGDGLLPEERLRKESEGGANPSEKQAPSPEKKPKIKTIRIWLRYFAFLFDLKEVPQEPLCPADVSLQIAFSWCKRTNNLMWSYTGYAKTD